MQEEGTLNIILTTYVSQKSYQNKKLPSKLIIPTNIKLPLFKDPVNLSPQLTYFFIPISICVWNKIGIHEIIVKTTKTIINRHSRTKLES